MFAISDCKAQDVPPTEITGFILPKPTGKYSVARHFISIKDSMREQREIPVFLYYPVKGSQVASFIIPTEAWRNQYLPVLKKKLGDSAGNTLAISKAYFARPAVPVKDQKFPLVLFSPGLGWSTLEYSFIIQELVSNGYIVAAINSSPLSPVLQSPGGMFINYDNPPDKYQLVADDIVFVLQQLKLKSPETNAITRYIDFKNIGIAGHSLGGAAAILATAKRNDIKAVVNMDGDLLDASAKATPNTNVLFLNQLPATFKGLSFAAIQADTNSGWRYQQMRKAASLSSNAYYISIAGMYHSNFQDYALLSPSLIPETIRKWRLGPIDGTKCLHLITQTLTSYFNKHLKQKETDLHALEKSNDLIRVIVIR